MVDNSPEQERFQEPEGLSEATGSDSGSEVAQDPNPLARAFQKL